MQFLPCNLESEVGGPIVFQVYVGDHVCGNIHREGNLLIFCPGAFESFSATDLGIIAEFLSRPTI